MDDKVAEFEIPPTLGIRAYVNQSGSISLEQHDPFYDDEPRIVVIEAYQVDTVIGWLQQLKAIIEA